jgi:hypothetical protein
MTTLDQLALEWLLESDTPAVRALVLRDLLDRPADDPELCAAQEAAHRAGPVAAVLDAMDPQGYWVEPGPGYNPKYVSTVWALILLAQLGARAELDARILYARAYLLDHALAPHGQFTASGAPSGTADCLQGNLCWALTTLGGADERLDRAYEWLARSNTGAGVAPQDDRAAPLRYYAGKCGPGFACGANNRLPCAWGAVKAVLALGRLPADRQTALTQAALARGVDFLLSVDPAGAGYPCGYSEKPSQSWWKFGFPVFYVTDILQVVEALSALGLGADPRLAAARALIRAKQDPNGRWALEYDYSGKTWGVYGAKKQPNKWVTLRALRALREH